MQPQLHDTEFVELFVSVYDSRQGTPDTAFRETKDVRVNYCSRIDEILTILLVYSNERTSHDGLPGGWIPPYR